MKRDMDTIREILLKVESLDPDDDESLAVDDIEPKKLGYHLSLLQKDGYIDADDHTGFEPTPHWDVRGLTSKGHDFLDSARDRSVWDKAKRIAAEKAGAVSLSTMKAVLAKLVAEAVLK